MAQTGLGVALRLLRERRGLSLRETGLLADIDHAYLHRLESGEKTSPSEEVVARLLKALKPSDRDSAIVKWLATHVQDNADIVSYTLNDSSIELDIFTAAAGMRHRGTARPDPATLIARVRQAFADD